MKRILFTQTFKAAAALAVALQLANGPILAADKTKEKKAESSSTTLSKKEVAFMTEAASGGLTEVRMGELAQLRGVSAEVKQLGQRLITDHNKANDELKELAGKKGLLLSIQIGDKHQRTLDKLSSSSKFDKQFKETVARDHKKDIKEFEKAEKKCEDPDLKAWINKTLPALQEHLRMAEQLGVTRTARTQ